MLEAFFSVTSANNTVFSSGLNSFNIPGVLPSHLLLLYLAPTGSATFTSQDMRVLPDWHTGGFVEDDFSPNLDRERERESVSVPPRKRTLRGCPQAKAHRRWS